MFFRIENLERILPVTFSFAVR